MTICQETSGFLFPHPCGRPAVLTCMRCGKLVCEQHARPQTQEGVLCITCSRTTTTDSDWGSDDDDSDDPHFYSSRYRTRAGESADPEELDFTEGDQGAFDDRDEEPDMGGS